MKKILLELIKKVDFEGYSKVSLKAIADKAGCSSREVKLFLDYMQGKGSLRIISQNKRYTEFRLQKQISMELSTVG